jgi:hypothetical protein
MEEVMNSIMRAFELAKEQELELPNISNNLEMLFSSIDEVEKAFSSAKERLMMIMSSSQNDMTKVSNSLAEILSHDVFMQNNHDHGQMGGSGTSMHADSMDRLLLMQHSFEMIRSRGTLMIGEMGGRDVEGLEKSKGSEGIEEPPSRPKKRYVIYLFIIKLIIEGELCM